MPTPRDAVTAIDVPPPTSPDVRRAWNWLPAQVLVAGATSFIVTGLWLSISDQYSEGLQVIGLGLVSAVITIAVFVLGLPLRVAPSLRRWWVRHPGGPVIVLLLGAGGLVLSYFVGGAGPLHLPADDLFPEANGYQPEGGVFIPSLGILAFAAMHLLPPRRRLAETA